MLDMIFDIVVVALLNKVLAGLGRAVRKLLGQPVSATGKSEMWIGAAVLAALVVVVIAVLSALS